MADDVQAAVGKLWAEVNNENFSDLADFDGYQADFHALFGFGINGIDYDKPTELERPLV